MEVGVHEFVHEVHVLEVIESGRGRLHDVFERNHVFVLQLPQQRTLTQRPARIDFVLESVLDHLDRDLLACTLHLGGAHNAIRAFTDRFDGLHAAARAVIQ